VKRLLGFLARYLGWLTLAAVSTLGGGLLVMLFRDWTLKALLASTLAWPLLGLAMVLAVPIAMLGLGRVYLYSAVGGGLIFSGMLALI
jgi:hypothetical protein